MARPSLCRPEDYHELMEAYDEHCESTPAPSPAVLRNQIRKFLEGTGVTQASFLAVIGVNANSFGKFMGGAYKDKWSATMNGTYSGARYFFFREKKLGKKSIANTLKSGKEASASASAPPPPPGAGAGAGAAAPPPPAGAGASAPAPPTARPPLPDLSGVELEDENVYLNPKEVRAGITALGKKYKFTHPQLVSACGLSCPSNAVGRFMNKGGEFGGREMDIYRPLALLLEKVRVQEGKPKSKKRKALEAEAASRPGKAPFLGLDPNARYLVPLGASLAMGKDALGRFQFARPW